MTGNNLSVSSDKRVKMSLKAKVEAIIYAAEEPVTLEQISLLLRDIVLADLASAKENAAIEQADSAAEAASSESAEDDSPFPELCSDDAAVYDPLASATPDETLVDAVPADALPTEEIPAEPAAPDAPEDASTDYASTANIAEQPESVEVERTEHVPPSSAEETPAEQAPAQTSESAPVESVPEDQTPAPVATEPATEQLAEQPASPDEASTPAESAGVSAPETTSRKRQPKKTEQEIAEDKAVRARIREILIELLADYSSEDRGMEIRQVAGGFRMATKPEHHDVVRAFAKSLKPPIRLSLAALETLAVIAYKQPITAPEIADIRGVESASVLGTLLDRKLITTAGRKQVIGRPMQYKTSKDFLLRFGLNDVNELPSMEEFSQLASDGTIEIAPSEPQETPSLFEPDTAADSASGEAGEWGSLIGDQPAPEPQSAPDVDSTALEAHQQGSQLPESQQQDAAEAADSQPQSEAESSNVPETEHPIGK
jgi:segregation and condensation protein B